jgi:hypothetical protein
VPVKGLSIGERTGNRWFQGKPRMDYEGFFFTRNELCIRSKTSVSQRLPDAYKRKFCVSRSILWSTAAAFLHCFTNW